MESADEPKTLYVGNLHISVTEELILALFNQIGPVESCKIIREPNGGDPYCFVEFGDHQAASTALVAMNKRRFLDKEIRVNWAASNGGFHKGPPMGGGAGGGIGGGGVPAGMMGGGGGGPAGPHLPAGKVDTSQHHHIFVGDLSPEIDTEMLRTAFAPFGDISDCRVVKDLVSQKSKGYGFVSFVRKVDAQTAIEGMNNQWLGSRAIRTNWATRKPPSVTAAREPREHKPLVFEDVFRLASAQNFTVYCGGLLDGNDDLLRRTFSPFGRIQEVRYFRDKGYAFIRYDNKDSACNAIVALHGTEVNGSLIKCSWGKENGGQAQGGPPPSQMNYQGGGGGGYGQNNYYGGQPQQPFYPQQQQQQQQQQYYPQMYGNPPMAQMQAPQYGGYTSAAGGPGGYGAGPYGGGGYDQYQQGPPQQ